MRRAEHRARAATTLIFFLTGAVFAAWSTRLPTIKEDLHLSDGALALAILGLEAGANAGAPAGGDGGRGAAAGRRGRRARRKPGGAARRLRPLPGRPGRRRLRRWAGDARARARDDGGGQQRRG